MKGKCVGDEEAVDGKCHVIAFDDDGGVWYSDFVMVLLSCPFVLEEEWVVDCVACAVECYKYGVVGAEVAYGAVCIDGDDLGIVGYLVDWKVVVELEGL